MKMKPGIYSLMVAATVAMFGVQSAFADVTAVYKMTWRDGGHGTQTIRYVDKKHIRFDMANDAKRHETTMMKLGDKVYAITGKVVQDMDQLSAMMAAMGKGGKDRHSKHAPIKYEDTGRTETIAGIKGKVYRFVEEGKQHEVVLGENKDLHAAVMGVMEITKAATGTGMMPEDASSQIQQDSSIKSMAMLRMDDLMRLQSVNTDHIQDSVFVLPAKPQQLGGGMGALLKSMTGK
jgi:hypothetical protein